MSTELRRPFNPARRGLRWGLLAAFLGLVLVPVIVLTLSTLIRETRLAQEATLERLDFIATTQAEELDEFIATTQESMRGVLTNPVTRGNVFLLLDRQGFRERPEARSGSPSTAPTFDAQESEFQAFATRLIVDSGARFDRLFLLNADGYVIGSSEFEQIGLNFGDEVWFRNTLTNAQEAGTQDQVVIFGPVSEEMGGGGQRRSYIFALPIYDNSGQSLGMLVGRVRVQFVANLVEETSGLGERGEILLVDSDLNILNDARLSGDTTSAANSEIIVEALAGEPIDTRWTDYRSEDVLGTYRTIETLNIVLIAKQDVAEAAAAQRELLITNLVIGVGVAGLAIAAGVFISQQITQPLEQLTASVANISDDNTAIAIPDSEVAEIKQLARAFNSMTSQINNMVARQEATISDRTRQLEITAQMGRIIAAETDLERLMNVTVDMIRDRLDYYHAQVFLIDDLRQFAVLRSSTGEAGKQLLARKHKLEVGSQSVIGQVTELARPVLAGDTEDSMVHKPNPLLPETRAELAVPLRLGDRIIGALDIQSTNPEAFDEGTISVLQTVADQLAVAIRNAQLFDEREGLLSSSLQLTRMLTHETWRDFTEDRVQQESPVGYEYDLSTTRPIEGGSNGGGTTNGDGKALHMPIEVRGQAIGTLEAELDEGRELNPQERELVSRVLDRMALALDNARLVEQTRTSLEETGRLYEASQNIADANTVADLAERLISVVADLDTVDRVILYTLEDPRESPGHRVVLRRGEYDVKQSTKDDQNIYIPETPYRLNTGEGPLAGIEDIPKDGSVTSRIEHEPDEMGIIPQNIRTRGIFPLVSAGTTLAWIEVQNTRQEYALDESDTRFLQTVSDQAATVLASVRLLDQTAARARRLQAVNEVTRTSTSILNIDLLMPLIVNQISSAFGYYHVQIFRVDELGEWANLVASTGEVGAELLRRNHQLAVGSDSVIGRVTSTGETVITGDTSDDEAVHRKNELLPETLAELAVPIKMGDRVIGALDVQSKQSNAFDEEAVLILQSLADQISVALENAQLFNEIQSRVSELSTINTVSQSVSRADTLTDLYQVVGEQILRTFEAQHGFLGVVRDGMIELPVFIDDGKRVESPPPTPIGQGLTSKVIDSGEHIMLNNNAEEAAEEMGAVIIGKLPTSLLIVPLIVGGAVIGAVSIQSDEENVYNDSTLRQMTNLANYIAIKIRNSELLADTQRSANELRFLFNMTRAAVQTTDLDTALENVANIIQEEIEGAETATAYLREWDAGEGEYIMVPHAASGYGADHARVIPVGEGLVGRAVADRAPQIVDDARFESVAGMAPDTRAALVVPLTAGREVIGAIAMGSKQVGVFSLSDADLLEAASGTLSAVIQNAQLIEQIERANEELREVDQLKSQFLANMSHELRTPLNSIIGFSKVILNEIDGPLTDLQRQDLTTINESGKHLLGLINDILDMSKIESGKMDVFNEYMELDDIVSGVMATSLALIKDKPVQLVEDTPSQLPLVFADSKRVRQVLLNLLSNASKFTHEGTVTLRIRQYEEDRAHGMKVPHVRLSVVDSGIGIREEDMPLLFEAFRQVDGSTTRQVGGTGLGLPITKEFIEMMGGTIWVESEVGKGSTFSFTLPLNPPADVETTPTGQLIDRSKPVILAVDDEPRVLDLYRRYLEGEDGYSMVSVETAVDLINRVRDVKPDAIILDIALPEKDGWQALEELKAESDLNDIPVIICSIHDERAKGLELGAAEYINKPIIEEDLRGALDRVLDDGQLDEQTVATTMHEPVYDAGERAAFEEEQVEEDAPIAEAPEPEPEPTLPEAIPSGPSGAPAVPREGELIRTLIIDPDADYGTAVGELLEDTEMFKARVTQKGFEGLGAVEQGKPHIIILDIDIEDMDGLGLLAAMRSNPSTQNVPVIILTERELTDEQLEPYADGITAYVNKLDHDADSLLEEIDELVAIMLYGFE